jgi:hypothetical protein
MKRFYINVEHSSLDVEPSTFDGKRMLDIFSFYENIRKKFDGLPKA